jgi:hypothetical protein
LESRAGLKEKDDLTASFAKIMSARVENAGRSQMGVRVPFLSFVHSFQPSLFARLHAFQRTFDCARTQCNVIRSKKHNSSN